MNGEISSVTQRIVAFGKAISDPTRQQIMQFCCCEWRNVSELVTLTHLAQSTVSHHLKILDNAGLVHVRNEGKKAYYTLNQKAISRCCDISADVFAPDIHQAGK